ncbi:MAG: histidine--tRNA ligase [Proteobacteria bacterium]|nr:MAG: histidine--tRNA ligase [Pseudomonadota bacterium]
MSGDHYANLTILESFELYAAKSGEELVNEQLYHFVDRGERKVAIRPEMTPTLARLVAGKFMELPKPIRWFSIPNLWRYEKPQKGRLREHWQLNIDVLGGERSMADAETLLFAHELIRSFGGDSHLDMRINHRGLMDQFFGSLGLASDQAHLVTKAIDAKDKIGIEKFHKWLGDLGLGTAEISKIDSFFNEGFEVVAGKFAGPAVDEVKKLFERLDDLGLRGSYRFDPSIMRGLNYYTGTVFEIYDTHPDNRRAMFGGGRYDNLLGLFGKNQLSGVGFGMGDVTLEDFLRIHDLVPDLSAALDVWVGVPDRAHFKPAQDIARRLRAEGLSVGVSLDEAGFGIQIKQALKMGARYALLFGEEEWKNGKVVLKNLAKNEQLVVEASEAANVIQAKN